MAKNTDPYKNLGARLQDDRGVLKDNPALLRELQEKVSASMTKLAQQPKNGGHPFLFALTAPKPHYTVDKIGQQVIRTAATDGRKFYWYPGFLKKLDSFEISIVMMHEGYHVLFDHVRRGIGRQPDVWNWAIDYVVNSTIEEDHEKQGRAGTLWGGALGTPLPLQTLLDWLDAKKNAKLPKTGEDTGLIFADKSLYGRSPETIYDEIMQHLENSPRKCPECGGVSFSDGDDPQKGKGKGDKSQSKGKDSGDGDPQDGDSDQDGSGCGHDHGDEDHCGTCGSKLQPMDGHIMPDMNREEALQDAMRAADSAKKMRGTVPSGVEDALGELVKPSLTWQDIVRHAVTRKKMDVGNKNDYKRYRRRPFSFPVPQYMPRKHDHRPKVLAMLDTSGSMSDDDIVYGVSQLQVLGDDMDCLLVCCDAQVYWEDATHAKGVGDLKRTKVVGRGGTVFDDFFRDFPKRVGKDFDVVICITDGFFGEIPMEYKPPMDVVFVITNDHEISPSFGRVAPLRSHKL
jgi:predicted metal-dependent peptidase